MPEPLSPQSLDQLIELHADFTLRGRDFVVVDFGLQAHLHQVQNHVVAQIRHRVERGGGRVAELVVHLVAGRALFGGRPRTFVGDDFVEADVRLALVAQAVEHEELGLGAEVGGVADAGSLEEGQRLLRDGARVAIIELAGAGLENVAEQVQARLDAERIDEGRRRVGHHEHVGLVDGLPAADGGAVEGDAFLEHRLVEAPDRVAEVLQRSEHVAIHQVDEFDIVLFRKLKNVFGSQGH
jgi:hypothetical protein